MNIPEKLEHGSEITHEATIKDGKIFDTGGICRSFSIEQKKVNEIIDYLKSKFPEDDQSN